LKKSGKNLLVTFPGEIQLFGTCGRKGNAEGKMQNEEGGGGTKSPSGGF
jgi:hypothetical protein